MYCLQKTNQTSLPTVKLSLFLSNKAVRYGSLFVPHDK